VSPSARCLSNCRRLRPQPQLLSPAKSIPRPPSLRYQAPPTLCLFFFLCPWAVATRRAALKVSTAPVVPARAGESEPRPKIAAASGGFQTRQSDATAAPAPVALQNESGQRLRAVA